jgi:SAM-dependent methyltransferase
MTQTGRKPTHMTKYTYNDNDLTMPSFSKKFSSRIGDGSGHHEEAFHDMIQILAQALSEGSLIDVGSGMGRTTLAVSPIVKEVVSLEPDASRWNYTRELVLDYTNTTVLNQTTGDYITENPDNQFDLVILGMVLQHLPTYASKALMNDIAALTRKGGLAVIATTRALDSARCFTYQDVNDGRLNAAISEEEFNRYAENTHAQDKGLPVRRFSRSEFESIVPAEFETVQWGQYSYYREEFLDYFSWLHSVEPDELINVGNSQFLVLKRG